MRALVLMAVVAAWVFAPSAASAHASLVGSEPADGAVLGRAPERIALTFNEAVAPLVLRLVNPVGEATVLRAATDGGRLVVTGLPPLGEGTHALSWRVISVDGHPVGGSILFSVGRPTGARPAATAQGDRAVAALIVAARVALYLGLFVGVGGSLFAAWIARAPLPRRIERTIHAAYGLGLVATVASIGLQGLDALALPLDHLGGGLVWATGLQTRYGLTAIVAIGAMLLGLGIGDIRGPAPRAASALALAGAGVALAASGHAAAAPPQWLARPAVAAHAICIVIWLGALLPLAALLREQGPHASPTLLRFARLIAPVAATLGAAGGTLAWLQLTSPRDLWTTAYGVILCVKLGAVAALAVLAARNRFALTPAVAAGDGVGLRTMRRAIGAEVALAVAVLALAAAWRFTPPPRALAQAVAAPVFVHVHTARAMSDVTIDPGRAGRVTVTIRLQTGDFAPLDAKEVTLVLANKDAAIEPFERIAARGADGEWRVDDLQLPFGGRWQIVTRILIDDFTRVSLEGEVALRP